MRVYIGNYINRWTSSVHRDYMNKKHGYYSWRDVDQTPFENFLDKLEDVLQSVYNTTINQYLDKKKRNIKVRVDYYDVWSADHTLALIILPTLKKLKEQSHGSPFVDPQDVPEELRPAQEAGDTNGYVDDTHFKRWDWVISEMIWAFEQIVNEENEDLFYDHTEYESAGDIPMMDKIGLIKVDREGLAAHHERIKRGTTLFGKYYRGLWD